MPIPDVDATLKEIEYAYDTLKADGAHFMTSYGDTWLGNAAYEPVMAELNRRKAVVHVHPTAANCCKNLVPDVSPGIMEYGTDTTRAIAERDVQRHSAALPRHPLHLVARRRHGAVPRRPHRRAHRATPGERAALAQRRHARDEEVLLRHTAGAANAGRDRLAAQAGDAATTSLFGTDFPPGGTSARRRQGAGRARPRPHTTPTCATIDRDNAVRLLPRLAVS